jgi:antitoxin CptB
MQAGRAENGDRTHGAPSADAHAQPVDERRLARIRWRCRRGMLENDLMLERYLEARGADLTEADCAALDRLLDLTDNELWDALCGRAHPADPEVAAVLAALDAASSKRP